MASFQEPELFPPPKSTTHFDLHLGDCVAGMKRLSDQSVDLVVTSPPYNLGIDYSSYDDRKSMDDYLLWSLEWAAEVRRVLRDDGAMFLNVGASPKNPWMPHELALKLRAVFELQNTIHWIKSITVETPDGGPLSTGHFKPINSPRYLNDCHEYVFHLTKDGNRRVDRLAVGVPYTHKSNIGRWKHTAGEDKRCRGNTWFIPYKTIQSRNAERPHPATFPVALAEQCIRLHGKAPEEMTMLEPFLGIGHAAQAAANLNVDRFIGFEIDESYLATARERLGLLDAEDPA